MACLIWSIVTVFPFLKLAEKLTMNDNIANMHITFLLYVFYTMPRFIEVLTADMFKLRKTPCAVNKTVLEKDKKLFNCSSSINVYHCIQDERNRTGEICIQPVWVQKSMCLIPSVHL